MIQSSAKSAKQTIKILARKSLQADKRRNIFVIITIAFAACLMTSIALFFTAFQEKTFGDMHNHYQAVITSSDLQTIEQIRSDSQIEKSGLLLGANNFRENEHTIIVNYEDQNHIELTRQTTWQGSLPSGDHEIMVESGYLQAYGLPETIGQTVSLDLGNGQSDYSVCGILESTNGLNEFTIVVSKGLAEAIHAGETSYELKVRLTDSEYLDASTLQDNIYSLFGKYGISEKEVFFSSNYFGMLEAGTSRSNSIIIGIFIIIACGIVIYSLFYTSVIGKTKEYGRLKILGATPRQIKHIIRKESSYLSTISIPIGILAGSLIAFLIMPSYWNWRVNLVQIAVIAIAMKLTVSFSTRAPIRLAGKVSAIEAIRITSATVSKKKSASRKLHHKITPARLAYLNFCRNKKKTILTMISFGFTSILFMCIATYSNSVNAESIARQNLPSGEYELRLSESSPQEMAALQSDNPFNEQLMQKINNIPGTSHIEVYQMTTIDFPNTYHAYLTVLGLTREQMDAFSQYMTGGSMDYDTMELQKGVVIHDPEKLLNYYYGLPENIGDTLAFTTLSQSSAQFSVVGDIDLPGFSICVIMTDNMLSQLVPETQNKSFQYIVETNGSNPDYRNQLYETVTDSRISITAFQDIVTAMQQTLKLLNLILYGIMSFTLLFAILNLINTLMTSLIARQQELGILQSVGLSKSQLAQMLSLECFCYILCTMVLTLTIGSACGYFLYTAFNSLGTFGALTYRFPVKEVFAFFSVLLILQALFSIAAFRYSAKQNLIERISSV